MSETTPSPTSSSPQQPQGEGDDGRVVSVYLEPTKRKVKIHLNESAQVGEVVQGMVTHLQQAEGFDLNVYLRDKVGDGFAPEWQLFRERENMQLLPPGAVFGELDPPIENEEMFTVKVNAKVAADRI